MSIELKPCPFCGSAARLALGESDIDGSEVFCVECCASAGHHADDKHGEAAASSWNTRAAPVQATPRGTAVNCPKCNAWTEVLETRKRKAGTYRRYECANLHRFSTVNDGVTRIDDGKLKRGRALPQGIHLTNGA